MPALWLLPGHTKDYIHSSPAITEQHTAARMGASNHDLAPDRHLSVRAILNIAARTFMSILFIASGTSKLTSTKAMQEYMEAFGVPGYLVYPAAAFELSTGTMMIFGLRLMEVGLVCSAWCLLTASIFHRDWQGDDGQTQQLMFTKNLNMAGGFQMLAAAASYEGLNTAGVLDWVKIRFGSNPESQRYVAEHESLLSKNLPPSYLYGAERRARQIV